MSHVPCPFFIKYWPVRDREMFPSPRGDNMSEADTDDSLSITYFQSNGLLSDGFVDIAHRPALEEGSIALSGEEIVPGTLVMALMNLHDSILPALLLECAFGQGDSVLVIDLEVHEFKAICRGTEEKDFPLKGASLMGRYREAQNNPESRVSQWLRGHQLSYKHAIHSIVVLDQQFHDERIGKDVYRAILSWLFLWFPEERAVRVLTPDEKPGAPPARSASSDVSAS